MKLNLFFFLNLLMSFFEIWKKCASISDERIVSSEHMRPNFSVINGFLTKISAKCNFKNFDFGAFCLTIKKPLSLFDVKDFW